MSLRHLTHPKGLNTSALIALEFGLRPGRRALVLLPSRTSPPALVFARMNGEAALYHQGYFFWLRDPRRSSLFIRESALEHFHLGVRPQPFV